MKTYVVLKEGITQRKSADKDSSDYRVMLARKVGEEIEVSDLAALDSEAEDLLDGVKVTRVVPGLVSLGYIEPALASKSRVRPSIRPARSEEGA